MLTKIRVQNFRSFRDLHLELGPFNVFVGANGAGKSNLIDAFRFIKDAVVGSASVAVARRGGWSSVRNRRSYSKKIAFDFQGSTTLMPPSQQETPPVKLAFSYAIIFTWDPHKVELSVLDEKGSLTRADEISPTIVPLSTFHRDREQIEIGGSMEKERVDSVGSTASIPRPASSDKLSLSHFVCTASSFLSEQVRGWRTYNVDPDRGRVPFLVGEEDELWETGSNLAGVLRQFAKTPTLAERLREIAQTLIPEFQEWETVSQADGTITYRIREKSVRPAFSPNSVSDGTIRLLMLLSVLLNERQRPSTILIEEPERSLHPLAMEQLVQLMREVSRGASPARQIIVTTHSPDFVRHCKPEEVFLMDKVQGATRVMRASNISLMDKFLEQFSLDELWTMGYLEAGIPNA